LAHKYETPALWATKQEVSYAPKSSVVAGRDALYFASIRGDSSGHNLDKEDGPGNWHDCVHVMVLDNSGNIYLTGRSRSHETDWDYLTVKYNENGDLLWAKIFNGESDGSDWPYALTVGPAGDVYVTGDSRGR
jgi:hypothetical protein